MKIVLNIIQDKFMFGLRESSVVQVLNIKFVEILVVLGCCIDFEMGFVLMGRFFYILQDDVL